MKFKLTNAKDAYGSDLLSKAQQIGRASCRERV